MGLMSWKHMRGKSPLLDIFVCIFSIALYSFFAYRYIIHLISGDTYILVDIIYGLMLLFFFFFAFLGPISIIIETICELFKKDNEKQ